MKKFYRFFLIVFSLSVFGAAASAQTTAAPVIGAQVFVEPGQTPEQIDTWFSILENCRMPFARIRLFGSHVMREDGTFDFSLYDLAFDSAERHGVKLFVTLFPPTDELTDVGGFKFPTDEMHLARVGDYIDHVVSHFKDRDAMYAWVLQNEPGTGSMSAPETPLAAKVKKEWLETRVRKDRTGYLEADWADQEFLVYYTFWYLNWIYDRVRIHDTGHYTHINPHQILNLLPEYDFASLEKILSSLGASMHLSWHFSLFDRAEYPVGISLMSDIIRSNALSNPFWITELQGGNVTASGYEVLCPTSEEISQWLWTGIGAGAEGIIFWTLNQRAAVSEAGEWGLLDFQNGPSDRLAAASEVAESVYRHSGLMADARPVKSNISILYNNESLWTQRFNANIVKDTENDARGGDAVMKSISAAYKAISSWGVIPEVCDMKFFDWDNAQDRVVVMPNIVAISSEYYDDIRGFVENGGHIVATGLTGYYDENMKCAFMGSFPLADVFGAQLREVRHEDKYFPLPQFEGITLDSHLWKSVLSPLDGARVVSEYDGEVYAVRNTFGKGEVLWYPSMVNLGCRHRNESALSDFYGEVLSDFIDIAPFRLKSKRDGVIVRTMHSGEKLIVVAINKSDTVVKLSPVTDHTYESTIYDNFDAVPCRSDRKMILKPQECAVTIWTN